MAGQDDDHILQLINQNEERNRQAFGSSNNHHASSFSVAGRISSLVDFDFRPSHVNLQSSQTNLNPTSGMFNPTTFNNANHHQHLKAASQAQPPMIQNNNNNNNNNNPSNPNAAYHHNQMATMGDNNQASPSYANIMNTNHQLFSGHIPIPNSMAPQTSRLIGGTLPANQLSLSGNLSVSTGTVPFIVHGQSNSSRPAGSETSKRFSSKNGDSPRRTFACPTCDKGFTEKFNMKRHMQIHSQSRPKYICNECSKSFAWKDNFIRHKKASHGTSSILYQA